MDYYLSKNDGLFTGPFAIDQLIANGLERDTLVWREGLAAWFPAYQLPELNEIIAETPPPIEVTLSHTANEEQQPLPQAPAVIQPAVNKNVAEVVKKAQPKPAVKANGDVNTQVTKKKTTAVTTEKKKEKEKKKTKTKYDHPVAPWFNESIWLLAFVIIHAILGLTKTTTFEYIYLDLLGAALSITGIVIGMKIKNLNKVSYAKGSATRNVAENLSKINGYLVSATAAIGFLVILVQSAHYVYVS
ncbi:MAG: DUF4339 domain-containing protein [Muribaculaceae bacterium]|nr:DUF4339 domain-containing protein [Muribaculaceae bacterium]MBR6489131.1 DUF4339 domain-containing protein [Muribaculaceae bacterium]